MRYSRRGPSSDLSLRTAGREGGCVGLLVSTRDLLDADDQFVDGLVDRHFSLTTRFIALAQTFSLLRIVNFQFLVKSNGVVPPVN